MDIGEKSRDYTTADSGGSSAASFDDGIFGYLGKSMPESNGKVVERKTPRTNPINAPHSYHNAVEPLPTTVPQDAYVPRVLDRNGKISTQGTLDAIKEQYKRESEDPFYLDDFGNPLYRGANEDEMTTLRNNRELVDENRRLIEDYLRSKQERLREEQLEHDASHLNAREESDGDDSYRHRRAKNSGGGFTKRLSVEAPDIDRNGGEDILPFFLKEERRRRR